MPDHLLLAEYASVSLQEGVPQLWIRRGPCPDQYALYAAHGAFCRSPPCAGVSPQNNYLRRKSRHASDSGVVGPEERAAGLTRTGYERSLLQRTVYGSVEEHKFRLCRRAHHGYAGRRFSYYRARLERTDAGWHAEDLLTEQNSALDRARAGGKRQ